MFIVDDILAAPGKAMLFLFRELAKKAKDDFLDDDAVKQQLQEIYGLLDAGTISGQEFESREIQLLQRLEQIARIKSGEAETLALPPSAADDLPTAELLRDQENLDRVMRWREEQHPAAAVVESAVAVSPLLPAAPMPVDDWPIAPPSLPTTASSVAAPSFAAPASFAAPPFMPPPPIAPAALPASLPAAASFDGQTVPVVGPTTMSQVIDSVFRDLAMLKLKVSSVTSVSRDDSGWRVTAEVVERRAVPDSGDLLGIYDLRLDQAGSILRYERTRLRRRSDLGR
jgi:Gas vesicle synthesis protein GvpO/Gas vesicle protein G